MIKYILSNFDGYCESIFGRLFFDNVKSAKKYLFKKACNLKEVKEHLWEERDPLSPPEWTSIYSIRGIEVPENIDSELIVINSDDDLPELPENNGWIYQTGFLTLDDAKKFLIEYFPDIKIETKYSYEEKLRQIYIRTSTDKSGERYSHRYKFTKLTKSRK